MEKKLTVDQIEKLQEHLNISNFKNNQAVNFDALRELGMLNSSEQNFIRRGGKSPSEWQEEYSAKIRQEAEEWIEKNLNLTDFKFPV